MVMNDKKLREALHRIQLRFGTPTTFITHKFGISREHLIRWSHNESYVISDSLKIKLDKFIKGEM